MSKEIEKQIESFTNRRAQLLHLLCESDRVFYPDAILGIVHEIRSITKILRIFKGSNLNDEKQENQKAEETRRPSFKG